MLFQSLAITATLLCSTAVARPAQGLDTRQTTPSYQCTTGGVHVIAVSGDGAVAINEYGLLGNLSNSIINAIPGSTTVQVPFEKGAVNKLNSTTQGSVLFAEYVNEYHASCPCSKVAVIGYSAGAIISMNAICGASLPWKTPVNGFDASYRDFIVGIIAYGDETRTSTAPYNRGTCTGNGRFPRTPAIAACPNFADRIQSFCDTDDPQCCLGFDQETHYVYDLEYDGVSTQYIAERVASFGDVCEAAGTTTTAIATTPVPTSAAPTSTTVSTPVVMPSINPATTVITKTEADTTTVVTETHVSFSGFPTSGVAPSVTASSVPAPTTTFAPEAPTYTAPPAVGPSPIDASPANPGPAHTSAPAAAVPTSPTANCPETLDHDWQFPHLIVPVSSTSPNTAFGTSYDGKVDSTTSSIFNFDVPPSYAGKSCSVFFNLPKLADLKYSSFTTSGGPGVSFALLKDVATLSTSYANKPSVETTYGDFTVTPGSGFIVASGPCAAGKALSYEMSATGDYALEYFQAYGEPIGLYMTAC